jgi:hypothetical protein
LLRRPEADEGPRGVRSAVDRPRNTTGSFAFAALRLRMTPLSSGTERIAQVTAAIPAWHAS